MKTWDASALAQLETGGGAIRVLITADFGGTTYRFIDEPVSSLTLGGDTYTGLGDGVAFSGVPDAAGMTAGRFNFSISSAALILDDDAQDPITVFSSIYDEDYKEREIDVEYAVFSSAPGNYVGKIPAISGRMNAAPLEIKPGKGQATLSLECQTLGQDFRRTNGGVRSSAHVRRFYSSDEFGDFIIQAVTDRTGRWGYAGDGAGGAGGAGATGGNNGRPPSGEPGLNIY